MALAQHIQDLVYINKMAVSTAQNYAIVKDKYVTRHFFIKLSPSMMIAYRLSDRNPTYKVRSWIKQILKSVL